MRRCRPDYGRCIANLACSVLRHYGIQPPNSTLAQIDAMLEKHYRNVVVLLLDGMGMNVLHKHLSPDGFLRRHLHFDYSSVFPPTTVAAVTAVCSGLYPAQSAWLGWSGYFPQIDRNVVYFLNTDNDTQESISDMQVADTFVPYEKLTKRICGAGVETHELAPWLVQNASYDGFCTRIEQLCANAGRRFIYAYWDQPDKDLHLYGVEDERISALLQAMEQRTEQLAAALEDTLLLITADHGMINMTCESWEDMPELAECLLRMPSMEARAVNLFVKPERKETFQKAFEKRFGKDFLLLSKEEVLSAQLLGTGSCHPQLDGMLGDYLAIGTGSRAIRVRKKNYRGEHAGLTEEEMRIPLIAVEKGKSK